MPPLPYAPLPALPTSIQPAVNGAAVAGQFFPFMSLPKELRRKILGFVAVKQDGYIGEPSEGGVDCALSFQRSGINMPASAAQPVTFHFPTGCLSPVHMKQQISQDFRKHRCLNIASTCQQMFAEVTEAFYKDNGFEFRDPVTMFQFLCSLGPDRTGLIKKFRLGYDIDLTLDDLGYLFQRFGVDYKGFYQLLEEDYLDDAPGSNLVRAFNYVKACKNIRKFELVYRLNMPGDFFRVAGAPDARCLLLAYAGYRLGECQLMELRTGDVLEKLRQDDGERTNQIFNVSVGKFSTTGMMEDIARMMGRRAEDFSVYLDRVVTACLAHSENCIENTAVGGNRLMAPF